MYLFIHGGMIGGNCWNKLQLLFQNSFAPSLTGLGDKKHLATPLTDLQTHIQDVLDFIQQNDLKEIILVGHSYSGMIITGVADKIPHKIKKLIFISAIFPKPGESMFDAIGNEIASQLLTNAQNSWQVPPASPEIYGITSKEDQDWFIQESSPHPLKSFQQKLEFAPDLFKKIPTTYIHCSQDMALRAMADRAIEQNIRYLELDTGHFPMLTHPNELAALLK